MKPTLDIPDVGPRDHVRHLKMFNTSTLFLFGRNYIIKSSPIYYISSIFWLKLNSVLWGYNMIFRTSHWFYEIFLTIVLKRVTVIFSLIIFLLILIFDCNTSCSTIVILFTALVQRSIVSSKETKCLDRGCKKVTKFVIF